MIRTRDILFSKAFATIGDEVTWIDRLGAKLTSTRLGCIYHTNSVAFTNCPDGFSMVIVLHDDLPGSVLASQSCDYLSALQGI